MKSFIYAIIIAVVLAVAFVGALSTVQQTAEAEFHTVSARP